MAAKEEKIETSVSEEELNWIKALRDFKLSPDVGDPKALETFLKTFNKREEEKMKGKATPVVTPAVPTPLGSSHHFPKLSIFSGDNNKGEVSWESFKYEVDSLVAEHTFTEEQLLLGIRRSLKGTASDIVRRLGTGITVKDIVTKLNSTYGSIESAQTIMQKFYSCAQGMDTVATYAIKVEDLYSQAIQLGAIIRNETLLKQIFYQGLRLDLKLVAQYKYDTIEDYDKFKVELRKLEQEIKQSDKPKTCHAAQKVEEKSELSKMNDTLKVLQEKIEKLEAEKEQQNSQEHFVYGSRRGRRATGRFRSNTGRGRGGRGQFRPTGTNSFTRGNCHRCGERGHYARDCDRDVEEHQVTCYRCQGQGHYARDCQVDLTKDDLNE